eukprot:g2212.t1
MGERGLPGKSKGSEGGASSTAAAAAAAAARATGGSCATMATQVADVDEVEMEGEADGADEEGAAPRPVVVVLRLLSHSHVMQRLYLLQDGLNIIGRDAEKCTVVLNEALTTVSLQHCEVRCVTVLDDDDDDDDDGSQRFHLVADRGSTNGTFVAAPGGKRKNRLVGGATTNLTEGKSLLILADVEFKLYVEDREAAMLEVQEQQRRHQLRHQQHHGGGLIAAAAPNPVPAPATVQVADAGPVAEVVEVVPAMPPPTAASAKDAGAVRGRDFVAKDPEDGGGKGGETTGGEGAANASGHAGATTGVSCRTRASAAGSGRGAMDVEKPPATAAAAGVAAAAADAAGAGAGDFRRTSFGPAAKSGGGAEGSGENATTGAIGGLLHEWDDDVKHGYFAEPGEQQVASGRGGRRGRRGERGANVTHLVWNGGQQGLKRTVKILEAMALAPTNVEIVGLAWLEASAKAKKPLPIDLDNYERFLPVDTNKQLLAKHGVNIAQALMRRRRPERRKAIGNGAAVDGE